MPGTFGAFKALDTLGRIELPYDIEVNRTKPIAQTAVVTLGLVITHPDQAYAIEK